MERIEVEHNPLGFEGYITNRTSIACMPKEDYNLFVSSLMEIVIDHFSELQRKENL